MSKSNLEEILAGIYVIAGIQAMSADIRWLAWVCFVKAAIDTLGALAFAFKEAREEMR